MFEPTPFYQIKNPKGRLTELEARIRHQTGDTLRSSLLEALLDPYAPLRRQAAFAFEERVTPALCELLANSLLSDQTCIEQLRSSSLVPDVLGQIDAESDDRIQTDIRQEYCLILRFCSDDKATRALLEYADSPEPDVRFQALKSLHFKDVSEPRLRELLNERLSDDDEEIAVIASQIAADRQLTSLFDPIHERMGEATGTNRFQFALALIELGDEQQLDKFQETLLDVCTQHLTSDETVSAASEALLKLGEKRAVDALRDQLNSWFMHPLNRVKIASVLIQFEDDAGSDYFEKALDSWRKDVRGYTLQLIGRHRLDAFFDRLLDKAKSTDYHADTAIIALGQWGDKRAEESLRALTDNHDDERLRALAKKQLETSES